MRAAGFDIGTTTVCGVLIDLESGRTVKTQTRKNDSWIKGESYERLQDPARIWQLVQAIYQDFLAEDEIAAIGLTGQMHGLVYVDAEGSAVSPLYTWEDERGIASSQIRIKKMGRIPAEKLWIRRLLPRRPVIQQPWKRSRKKLFPGPMQQLKFDRIPDGNGVWPDNALL